MSFVLLDSQTARQPFGLPRALHLFQLLSFIYKGIAPGSRSHSLNTSRRASMLLPCCCHPFNCPFPFAASFCIYIRFFFGFFTVGYSKLISELFTKSHFSPSAHFTSIHNLSPLASSFKFASSSSRLSACSRPPFLESSSTQILCILDEFSSKFCFHQNFRCWKRARRGKKFVVFRCYFYAT